MTEIKMSLKGVQAQDKSQVVDNLPQDFTSANATLKESHVQLKMTELNQSEQANIVVDDLPNRMRRNSLIFTGVPEQQTEKWTDTEKLTGDLVEKKNLDVQAGKIERTRRIGQQNSGYDPPTIIKFLSFKEKTNILIKEFKLNHLESPGSKGTFSPEFNRLKKIQRLCTQ